MTLDLPPVTTLAPGPLEQHLRARRDAGAKLLVPYLTGGLGDWTDIVGPWPTPGPTPWRSASRSPTR